MARHDNGLARCSMIQSCTGWPSMTVASRCIADSVSVGGMASHYVKPLDTCQAVGHRKISTDAQQPPPDTGAVGSQRDEKLAGVRFVVRWFVGINRIDGGIAHGASFGLFGTAHTTRADTTATTTAVTMS